MKQSISNVIVDFEEFQFTIQFISAQTRFCEEINCTTQERSDQILGSTNKLGFTVKSM